MANIVAPRIASPSYARVRAELSQIYIYSAYHGGKQTKGETNDGVDPLKGSGEIPDAGNQVFYAFFLVISGEWETRGRRMMVLIC